MNIKSRIFRIHRIFLLYRVFGAQKYRHALRENKRISSFFQNGGEKAKFDEYLSLYLKDNCSDGKVNVRYAINISYLVNQLSLQHISKDFETEKTIWKSGVVMLGPWSYLGMTNLSATLYTYYVHPDIFYKDRIS